MLDTDMIVNILLIALMVWFIYRSFAPVKGIKTITTSELKLELKKNGKQFIDVRTPNEFQANSINGFKNIPLYELQKRANELSKEKEVLVICQSGMRSSKASKMLKKLGFKHITNVKGGMSAW
ncbi:rhodanese-like domain-containing protein [Domibacillus epiphyticus]|uniref:Rhodanese n=1 Tax=Domibacillus epiphyticus TaxID=1714355 RepID=A0A1V2A5U2_9BACI|nr:rhodanese-like domain-containing protein [Domibacillus epiphyticus]OMP66297.1 rhodanese [Domibacillus epiphyticus]